jgi:hypothetical protein
MKKPSKPRNSDEAIELLKKIGDDYQITDPSGLLILGQAHEAVGRLREAQAILAAEGCIVRDRFNQPKQHPATLIERDSRSALLQAIASLHLDLEPLRDQAGRPPGK